MKRGIRVLGVLLISVVSVSVFAYEEAVYEDEMSWVGYDDYSACTYSDTQLQQLETVSDLLTERGEEKVVQRLFGSDEIQTLARAIVDETRMSLEYALDACEGQYLGRYPYDMEEAMSYLQQQIVLLSQLRGYEASMMSNDPIPGAMKMLRDHLVPGDLWNVLVSTDPFVQDETASITAQGTIEGTMFEGSLDAVSSSLIDSDDLSSSIDLQGAIQISDAEGEQSGSLSAMLDVVMVDGVMYVQMDDVSVEVPEDFKTEEYESAMTMLQLFEGKYIEVDLGMMMPYGMAMGVDSSMAINSRQSYLEQDWLVGRGETTEGVIVGLNPMVCTTMGSVAGSVSECVRAMITEHGAMTMLYTTNDYSGDSMLMSEDGVLKLIWNDEEVIAMDFDMGADQSDGMMKVSYSDGVINGSMSDEYSEMMMDISGTITNGDTDVTVEWTSPESERTVTLTMTLGMSSSFGLDIEATRGENDIVVAMTTESVLSDAGADQTVQAPAPDDVVQLESLMGM